MLLGYCYGGILAYELYQKIRREGIQEPFHIFMSATDAADGTVYGRSLFENQEAREEVQDLMTTYFPDHVFPDKELVTEISNRCVDCLYAQYAQRGEIGMIPYEDIFNEDAKGSRLEQIRWRSAWNLPARPFGWWRPTFMLSTPTSRRLRSIPRFIVT